MRCGLIGRRLGHSYSCQIHHALADYSYELWELEPEELAGVAAAMTGDALTLEYDGTILDAGTLSPRVSGLSAAPLLLDAFPRAYLDSCGSETLDGADALRVDFSAAAGSEALGCTLYFGADGAPVYGELAQDGKIIAAVEFTNFIFGDILSPDA